MSAVSEACRSARPSIPKPMPERRRKSRRGGGRGIITDTTLFILGFPASGAQRRAPPREKSRASGPASRRTTIPAAPRNLPVKRKQNVRPSKGTKENGPVLGDRKDHRKINGEHIVHHQQRGPQRHPIRA